MNREQREKKELRKQEEERKEKDRQKVLRKPRQNQTENKSEDSTLSNPFVEK